MIMTERAEMLSIECVFGNDVTLKLSVYKAFWGKTSHGNQTCFFFPFLKLNDQFKTFSLKFSKQVYYTINKIYLI